MALKFLNIFVYLGLTLNVEFVLIPIFLKFQVQRNSLKFPSDSLELSKLPQKKSMAYLSSVDFDRGVGQQEGVVIKIDGIAKMMDYSCMDSDRRYFISTASLLSYGRPYSRV